MSSSNPIWDLLEAIQEELGLIASFITDINIVPTGSEDWRPNSAPKSWLNISVADEDFAFETANSYITKPRVRLTLHVETAKRLTAAMEDLLLYSNQAKEVLISKCFTDLTRRAPSLVASTFPVMEGNTVRSSMDLSYEMQLSADLSVEILRYQEQASQTIELTVEGLDAAEFEIRKADGSVVTSPAGYTGTSGTARVRVFDAADLTKLERVQLDIRGPEAPSKTVPDCATLDESAANAAIIAANLVPDSDGAFSPTVAKGLVISQSPLAGADAYAGSTVTITVSFGPEYTVVPDVTGLTAAAAEAALVAAGLVLGTSTSEMTDDTAAGLVSASSPAAGTGVAAGSAVDLTVSLGDRHYEIPVKVYPGVSPGLVIAANPQAGFYWKLPDGSILEGAKLNITGRTGRLPEYVYFCAREGYTMAQVWGISDFRYIGLSAQVKLRDLMYTNMTTFYGGYAGLVGNINELPKEWWERITVRFYLCIGAYGALIEGDLADIGELNANELLVFGPCGIHGIASFKFGSPCADVRLVSPGFTYADIAATIINWDNCNADSFARTGNFNNYKRSLIEAANPGAAAAITSLIAKGCDFTFLAE